MARVEIDEADLLQLQHVSGITHAVMQNPTLRQDFLRMAKTVKPDLSIPEVDAAAPVMNALDEVRKEFREYREEQTRREREAEETRRIQSFQNRWAEQEAQLRQSGWRAAGVEAVKKFAEENGIADLGIAADAYQLRNPQPEPASQSGAGWSLFGDQGSSEDTYVKDMMQSEGADEGRLDREIREALNSVRSVR